MKTITISDSGPVRTVTLNRPEVRNAFDRTMIEEIRGTFSTIPDTVRAVVLTGAESTFCAGADVAWMRDSINCTEAENLRDAAAMEAMLRAIDECPAPVIGRINGPALGGGMGLVACCDIAVAIDTAQFGFTEVRLGIVPAVISPYSIAKIGPRAARRLFLTGETFDAAKAHAAGLVHEVVNGDQLDSTVHAITDAICRNGPQAVRIAKALIREIVSLDREGQREHSVATIARVRVSAEGQEGLLAFLEKRRPKWHANP